MTFKDSGVVLKETHVGESDKIITLLTKEHGKISISARGARKPKSKFAAATQLFCFSEFVIFQGSRFMVVSQAEVINSFYSIRNDYEMLCYASLFLEMTDRMIFPEMQSKDILKLLLKTFSVMAKGSVSPELAASIFQLKFLQIEGLEPHVSYCSHCEKEAEEPFYFGENGLMCKKCVVGRNEMVYFSETARYAAQYILSSELDRLFSFTLSETARETLLKAVNYFRNSQLDIKFKSLEFK